MKNTHNFFLGLAREVAKASYCKRAQVGAIIVKDGNIISFGYNGTPKGFDNHCEDCNHTTKNDVLHAESNAITKCAKSCYSSEGSVLYCTMSPCFDCSKLIIQSGIKQVYFIEAYRNLDGIDLLKKANIYVEQIIL
jgi:dCMP deaminase